MRRLLLALALSGCTLAVDGLEPPACDQNAQCAVLNELAGIPSDACELYQCSPETARCEISARDDDRDGWVAPQCADAPLAQGMTVDCNDEVPSGTELCNGRDDDCDGVIDERSEPGGVPPIVPPSTQMAGSFNATGFVAYGASPTGGLAMVHTDRPTALFGLVSGTGSTSAAAMTRRRASSLASLTDSTLASGCHVLTSTGYEATNCDFHEVGVGLTAENVFAVSINRVGCDVGQVRVGYFPRTSGPEIIERGPLRRSNVFAGVDIDVASGTGRCTGASRSSGVRGAARPSVAAMDPSGVEDQALAAWIADTVSRPACAGTPAEVEVLGLHVQQDTVGTGWVTGSNSGVPEALGTTIQGGPPGIAVLDGTGYLVGFGAPGGGIALAFVEMMARPPAFDRDGDPDVGIPTARLTVHPLGTIPTSGLADDVALASGSLRRGGIDVGVTWRQGCGSGSDTIHFRQLFLSRDGSSVALDEARSFPAIELTTTPTAAGPPAIAATASGMLARGVVRADGRPTGVAENDGGYVVAWPDVSNRDPGPNDDTRILARRISEADGALLSPDEVLVLNAPGDVRRLRPTLYVDESDRVLYSFLAVGEGFRGGSLTCQP